MVTNEFKKFKEFQNGLFQKGKRDIKYRATSIDVLGEISIIGRWKGRKVRHFKGKEYLVEDVAWHTENEEYVVIYRALYGNCELYVRPLTMFLGETDRVKYPIEKYPEYTQEYRMEIIDD